VIRGEDEDELPHPNLQNTKPVQSPPSISPVGTKLNRKKRKKRKK